MKSRVTSPDASGVVGTWKMVQGVSRIIPVCPFCGYCKLNNDAHYNFCPNCGADMMKGGAK